MIKHEDDKFQKYLIAPNIYNTNQLIRVNKEQDFPIFTYRCVDTNYFNCKRPDCPKRRLSLKGYIAHIKDATTGIRYPQEYPLPALPSGVEADICADHRDKFCKKCDTFVKGVAFWNMWEWHCGTQKFVYKEVKETDNLKHGYWDRNLFLREDKKEKAVKRKTLQDRDERKKRRKAGILGEARIARKVKQLSEEIREGSTWEQLIELE